MTNRTFHLRCSFCGKEAMEVRKLITGPQVHICDECVTLCNEILAQDGRGEVQSTTDRRELKPRDIKAYLDERCGKSSGEVTAETKAVWEDAFRVIHRAAVQAMGG